MGSSAHFLLVGGTKLGNVPVLDVKLRREEATVLHRLAIDTGFPCT
jgi:hypothetical protein